ncbi:MAG TPA: AlpA family transcriptional regulator [Thiotrichales bacterium]|nr:AlpA family transcriptional regulator [Thiotrichales bacterium]
MHLKPLSELIRIRLVMQKTSLSKSQIYKLSASGNFPKPIRLGVSSVAWLTSEVDGWIRQRINARDTGVSV